MKRKGVPHPNPSPKLTGGTSQMLIAVSQWGQSGLGISRTFSRTSSRVSKAMGKTSYHKNKHSFIVHQVRMVKLNLIWWLSNPAGPFPEAVVLIRSGGYIMD
jgi:hypothetical protein